MTGTVLPQALFDAYDRLYAEIGRLHCLTQISTQGGVEGWFESFFRQHEVVREAQTEILQHCEGTFALLSARDLPRNELAQLIAMVRNGESTEEAWQRFVAQWPRAYAEALEVTGGANPATPPAKGKAGGGAGRKRAYFLNADKVVWASWKAGGYASFDAFLNENPQKHPYGTVLGMRRLQARMKQRNKSVSGD